MNPFFHQSLLISINGAIAEADAAAEMDHKYLRGKLREIAVRGIISPWLTNTFGTGSGKVTDCDGQLSGEIDILIFANDTTPPLVYSNDGFGLYPCESCLATIEIKSLLNATELKTTLNSSAILSDMNYQSGQLDEHGTKTIDHSIIEPVRCLFAFASDLTDMTELDRYLKYAQVADSKRLDMICVVGKGFWVNRRTEHGVHGWESVDPTPDYQEVVAFCSILSSGLAGVYRDRGRPPIARYFGSAKPEPVPKAK